MNASPHTPIEWTRANLAEVLPDQLSPQALHAYTEMLNRADRQFMGRLLAPVSVLGPVFKAFHGRLYFNLTQLRRCCAIGGSPAADLLRSLGHSEEIQPEDEIAPGLKAGALFRYFPDLLRVGVSNFRAGAMVRAHEQRVARMLARFASIDPSALDDRALWSEIERWVAAAPDGMQVVLVLGSVMFHEGMLRTICRRVGVSPDTLVYTHLAAGARSVSTQQALDLVALADVARRDPSAAAYLTGHDGRFDDVRTALAGTAFLAAFDRFLERYGHRGRYESDWALPRYREDPAPLLAAIREHVQSEAADHTDAILRRQAQDAADAWREFDAALTVWQRLTVRPMARSILRRIKRHYVWREQVRSDLTRVLECLRAWHLTLAARFVARGWLQRPDDYFLLRLEEVGAAIRDPAAGARLGAIAIQRAAQMADERPLRMPMLMREHELAERLARVPPAAAADDGGALTGLCVSPGRVEGAVIVMRDPREFARMTRGAILVAPATDPSWTPLFTLAAGVIVEVGGMLSHASTIAREYGLPALTNVKHATSRLKDGDWVRLDATNGRVDRIRSA